MNPKLIHPGKLKQNAYIQSLNGRFRDEYLRGHWFTNLNHARRKSLISGEITTSSARIRRWITELRWGLQQPIGSGRFRTIGTPI